MRGLNLAHEFDQPARFVFSQLELNADIAGRVVVEIVPRGGGAALASSWPLHGDSR
jgi:hypothetical protein